MVSSIKDTQQTPGVVHLPPRLVEIAGPAGAGKTTVTRILTGLGDHIRLRKFPDVREISSAPFYTWHGLLLSLGLLRIGRKNSRQLTKREFAWLSILKGWPPILRRDLEQNGGLIILDQGPIYLFSQVDEFGPEYLESQQAESLWQGLYRQWASTLDVVVWLDALDENLVERIRTREKWHEVKSESTIRTREFLASYRAAYENIFSKLTAQNNDFRIIRYDTSQKNPDEIAQALLLELGLKDGNVETVR